MTHPSRQSCELSDDDLADPSFVDRPLDQLHAGHDNSSMPSRHWALKLGAKAPLLWTPAHERTFALCDQLWDDLRAEWIAFWRKQRALEDSAGDEELVVARAAAQRSQTRIDAAFQARRDQRRRSREMTVELDDSIRSALREHRVTLESLNRALRKVRAAIRPQLVVLWNERDRALRAIATGRERRFRDLHWSVCNDVVDRFMTAARMAAKLGRAVRPAAQHKSGSIYLQLPAETEGGERVVTEGRKRARIVGGVLRHWTWADLLAGRRRVALAPYDLGDRVRRRWLLLTVPCSADGGTLSLPVRIHREPGPGAGIKGVRVVRRKAGHGQWAWSVVFSIAGPVLTPISRGSGSLFAALVCVRTAAGALRVLDGVDNRGMRLQVRLPQEILAATTYADLLQTSLDHRAFDIACRLGGDAIPAYKRRDWRLIRAKALASGDSAAIDWVRGRAPGGAACGALLLARSLANDDVEKYAELSARILGDAAGRRRVEGIRSGFVRRRSDFYGRAARWIAERYDHLILAKCGDRGFSSGDAPEARVSRDVRQQRQGAALSVIEEALSWAFARAGGEFVDIPFVDRPQQCPICREEMIGRDSDRTEPESQCSIHGSWDRGHAFAMALWRDHAPLDRDRWMRLAEALERSRAPILQIDVELAQRVRSGRPVPSPLRPSDVLSGSASSA
jgi:hypothetical protein